MKTLWQSDAKNPNSNEPFFTVKEAKGYYIYGERAGRDSVAFILYNKNTDKYALINESKPPLGDDVSMTTAFGGSIDKDKPLIQIVQDEVREEAGYSVLMNDIHFVGRVFVSTQMNQFCHLYFVDVTNYEQGERELDRAESNSTVEWLNAEELLNLEDWKAPLIVMKYSYAKAQEL